MNYFFHVGIYDKVGFLRDPSIDFCFCYENHDFPQA